MKNKPISEVFHGDCMEFMAQFPDKFFDLAVVDIEYNIGASKPSKKPNKIKQKNGNILTVKNNNYKPKEWDFKLSSKEYFEELFRVSNKQIVFGGNYYGLKGGYLIWDKLNGDSDQFGCEMAWVSDSKRTDIVYYLWSGMFQGLYCGKDVKRAIIQKGDKSLNEHRIHPTQKPRALYSWIFENYTEPGFKILDTHMGSQNSRIVAFKKGFDFWGSEIDIDYFIEGNQSFEKEIALPLFDVMNKEVIQTKLEL